MFTPITKLDKYATQDEAIAKVQEIKSVCELYELNEENFICWDRVHSKYGEQISDFERDAETLDECTRDSRFYSIRFINFFIEQFNSRVENHIKWLESPKKMVRINGKDAFEITEDMVNTVLETVKQMGDVTVEII